jgi:LysM repeat protein
MTRRRAFLVLVVLPAVVSLAVTLLTLNVWERQHPQQEVVVMPTFSSTALIEPRATFPPETAAAAASAGIVLTEESSEGDEPTADSTEPVISGNGCENPVHTVEGGQVLGSIAEQYSVSIDDLITLNQMLDPTFDPNFLFIGQELVIPVCGIPTATPTGIPPNTAVPTRNVPTPINTATNPPAGAVAIIISTIRNAGDITSEALEIINQGSPVDLEGWTISGSEGNEEFTFPAFRLFTSGSVTIFTGIGEDSATALFWGLDEAVWEIGETVSLFDADGELQSEFTIQED